MVTKPETIERMKFAWKMAVKGVGTGENTKAKDRIEKAIGAIVENWSEIPFTANGYPRQLERVRYHCPKCKREAVQAFKGVSCLSHVCGNCSKSTAFITQDGFESKGQREVSEWIESKGFTIEKNGRGILGGQKQGDILVTGKNLIIEYDGLYYHSDHGLYEEGFKGKVPDRNYHLRKTEDAAKAGYRLIHLWEDEWAFRREAVCGYLESILGSCRERIGARECSITEVDEKELRFFYEKNHIQGYTVSNWSRVLRDSENRIVCAMSFAQQRYAIGRNDGQWELVRLASLSGCKVPGGASRLLRAFLSEYPNETIISYADRRWSLGNVYEKIGFKLVATNEPSFWWQKGLNRYHRMQYTKEKLKEDGADESLEVAEIMAKRKVYRIWDCGTLVYRLDPSPAT
jgi:hypothetical protein